MIRSVFLISLCAVSAFSLPANGQKAKPPNVEVSDFKAARSGDSITVDCKVANASPRAIDGLTIIFRFEDSGGKVVTTQKLKIDEPSLPPGQTSEISAQLKDAPYASRVIILSETGLGMPLRAGNAGPFSIE